MKLPTNRGKEILIPVRSISYTAATPEAELEYGPHAWIGFKGFMSFELLFPPGQIVFFYLSNFFYTNRFSIFQTGLWIVCVHMHMCHECTLTKARTFVPSIVLKGGFMVLLSLHKLEYMLWNLINLRNHFVDVVCRRYGMWCGCKNSLELGGNNSQRTKNGWGVPKLW